jgi:hypothetical protein
MIRCRPQLVSIWLQTSEFFFSHTGTRGRTPWLGHEMGPSVFPFPPHMSTVTITMDAEIQWCAAFLIQQATAFLFSDRHLSLPRFGPKGRTKEKYFGRYCNAEANISPHTPWSPSVIRLGCYASKASATIYVCSGMTVTFMFQPFCHLLSCRDWNNQK